MPKPSIKSVRNSIIEIEVVRVETPTNEEGSRNTPFETPQKHP